MPVWASAVYEYYLRIILHLGRICGNVHAFYQDLTVPAVDSIVQLKGRLKATVANPFNAAALRAKEKKAIEKVEQRWNPTLQVLSGAVAEDSAAGCVASSVIAKAFTFLLQESFLQAVQFLVSAGCKYG